MTHKIDRFLNCFSCFQRDYSRVFLIAIFLIFSALISSCDSKQSISRDEISQLSGTQTPQYLDANEPISLRVDDLISRMTLEEKIGQMTQVEKNSIRPGDITEYYIGSILSAGGGSPDENTIEGWIAMTGAFQREALATRLGIPLIYGVDAVHGHGNLFGATIFPHQIGLGAAGNPDLMYRIGQATAREMLATGIPWNFAPVLAVPQDIRWGRTFESFTENTELVTELGVAYMEGLQSLPDDFTPAPGQTLYVLATPKHFIGDGGTEFGSSTEATYLLDQGDMRIDESSIRSLFLPPYRTAVEKGAMSIMPSYSSWNGTKMHAQEYWLSDVLKGELGFPGFVISDLGALIQIDFNYYTAVVTAINAGVDMNMVPSDYKGFINVMIKAVDEGDIPRSRIDDAVRRILTVKFQLGLFDHPFADAKLSSAVGSGNHRELARRAVRESLVLLKNDNNLLPIDKDTKTIYVAGRAADDIGLQCGGWTITWQGISGDIQPGTTVLEGIRDAVSLETEIQFDASGQFEGLADVGIVVVGEFPYAEGRGDKANLTLSEKDIQIITDVRERSKAMVVILISGRPLIITDQYQDVDAWIAAWLPGTEGDGIADLLFGDYTFKGTLPFSWPRDMDQLPFDFENLPTTGCQSPLFPLGYGLNVSHDSPPTVDKCD